LGWPHFGAMLQRLNSSLDEELLSGDGLWPRDRLEQMDAAFTGAVLRAFAAGLESPSAAAATVSFRKGSQRLEEAAIESAWHWFADAKFQATAVEVLEFVRARSLSVTAERVRVEFRRRIFLGLAHHRSAA